MSEIKVFYNKCKELFTSNRSNSMPTPTVEEDDVDARDPEETRRTLRRSKSGRVKAKTRTRSMVSTFDFSLCEENGFEHNEMDARKERIDSEFMKRRIEKTWPGLQEEDDRKNSSDGRSEDK
ncbi:hypothetical protein J6590_048080 [Homalodisca vitripennis]|nr:hypothetical protein J6590_048080 [Homalodisca vitripennis]